MNDIENTVITIMMHLIQLTWNSIIRTKGALGIPTAYDNHLSNQPNPIPTCSIEDDLSLLMTLLLSRRPINYI